MCIFSFSLSLSLPVAADARAFMSLRLECLLRISVFLASFSLFLSSLVALAFCCSSRLGAFVAVSLSRGATRRPPPQAAAASASGAMDAASDSPEGDVEGETRDEWRRSGDSWRQLEAVDPRDQGDEKEEEEEEERATDGRTDADGCERTTERNGSNAAPAAAVTPASALSYASARETESRGRKRERENMFAA